MEVERFAVDFFDELLFFEPLLFFDDDAPFFEEVDAFFVDDDAFFVEPPFFDDEPPFFAALPFFEDDEDPFGAGGTLPPSRRASDKPMAMACLRLVTFLPEPLLSVPRLYLCISVSTLSDAFFPYLDAMQKPPAQESVQAAGPCIRKDLQRVISTDSGAITRTPRRFTRTSSGRMPGFSVSVVRSDNST